MKLSDSHVYKRLGVGTDVQRVLANLDELKITPAQLGVEYTIMSNTKHTVLTSLLTKLVDRGLIVMYYDPKVTNIVPFIPLYDNHHKMGKVLVNVAYFVEKKENELIDGHEQRNYIIPPKTIHSLLLGAATVLAAFDGNDFDTTYVCIETVVGYQLEMWLKVLNRISSISTSTETVAFFKYVLAKWLFLNRLDLDEERSHGYAIKLAGATNLNMDRVMGFITHWESDVLVGMEDVGEYFDKVVKVEFPQLERIDINAIIKGFSSVFGLSCVLAADYPTYVYGIMMNYFDDFTMFRNKIFKVEMLNESRHAANVVLQFVEKRLTFLLERAPMNFAEAVTTPTPTKTNEMSELTKARIELAKKKGLSKDKIELLSDTSLNDEQAGVIMDSLTAGTDVNKVKKFANAKYNAQQMAVLHQATAAGLDDSNMTKLMGAKDAASMLEMYEKMKGSKK